jgi:hypothetical protein
MLEEPRGRTTSLSECDPIWAPRCHPGPRRPPRPAADWIPAHRLARPRIGVTVIALVIVSWTFLNALLVLVMYVSRNAVHMGGRREDWSDHTVEAEA